MEPLEKLYRYLRWPMDPGEPESMKRYEAIKEFFLEKLGREIPFHKEASILDVAAGTGIASVALAEALICRGASVEEVVVTDVRRGDLEKAYKWLDIRGLAGIKLYTRQVDGRKLVEEVRGKYSYVLMWGSPLPHLSTWDYALIVANTRELVGEGGVFMVEQKNILPRVLHTNTYKDVYVSPGKAGGTLIVSIMTGYDEFTGMDVKQQYVVPGFQYIGEARSRLWDLATVLTITWLFYERVELYGSSKPGVESVVVAREPRGRAPSARSLIDTLPSRISLDT